LWIFIWYCGFWETPHGLSLSLTAKLVVEGIQGEIYIYTHKKSDLERQSLRKICEYEKANGKILYKANRGNKEQEEG